ncbi:hypothetical protein JMM81_08395 [Bacillus sp. V3B]|uniref:hypothetical protein n=1 Tax=Bacillus sp. V3B TaxID=2804915 RepID=UPI00210BB7B1|nr:hypothetical protein [Bacillus sp. V3B]MCQ6274979.1 hypothetical protein [Bacillus sp. V3B]
MKNLIELYKKHFIHPSSSIQHQQEKESKIAFKKGNRIDVTNVNRREYKDDTSALQNPNILWCQINSMMY